MKSALKQQKNIGTILYIFKTMHKSQFKHADPMVVNYDLLDKFNLSPVCINKVLLASSHAALFTHCQWQLLSDRTEDF